MSFSAASFSLKKTLLTLAVFFAGITITTAEPLRYSGSDFLSKGPEDALNAAIEKQFGEKPVSKLRGSIAGEKELRNGEADFAILFLPTGGKNLPEVQKNEWRVIPLGYQVAYVAVAAANPLSEISFKQLSSVFGALDANPAKSWADVGASGFNSSLIPCIGDPARTNAVSFFQHRVLPKSSLVNSAREFLTDAAAFKEIVNNPGAIAIVGSPAPADAPVKMLAVSSAQENEQSAAYAPIFTNIYNRDYPLSIPLYVVYPAKNRLTLKPVLTYLYSQEMADSLEEVGFLPLDPNLRKQFQKGIDNIK